MCLKSLVSFAKEPYKRDDILQKGPVILRSLPIVATPYTLYYKCIYTHVRASYVSIDSFESILKYNAHHKIHIYTLP